MYGHWIPLLVAQPEKRRKNATREDPKAWSSDVRGGEKDSTQLRSRKGQRTAAPTQQLQPRQLNTSIGLVGPGWESLGKFPQDV